MNNFANYLKGMNYSKLEFAFFILCLTGIKYALRYQGFSHLGYHSFERHSGLWKFSDDTIECLVCGVFEKSDKKRTLYKVPFVDSHPNFCLLRHLLVFVHTLSYDRGYFLVSDANHTWRPISDDSCKVFSTNCATTCSSMATREN